MPSPDKDARLATLASSREEKFDHWFAGRCWRVCTEITGPRVLDGHRIDYYRGYFLMEPPGTFQTPLGHRGRQGYLIQEISMEDGTDCPTDPVAFGRQALEKAIERYGLITGLPRRDPRRRGTVWSD
jgi:hypothetical protein